MMQGKLLIYNWSTRECHKLSLISSSIPFTTQSNVMLENVSSEKRWAQTKCTIGE